MVNYNFIYVLSASSRFDHAGSKCWIWMTSPTAPLSMSAWKMKVILYSLALTLVTDITLGDIHFKSDREETEMKFLLWFFWWMGRIGEHGTLLALHHFDCKSLQSLCSPLESPGHRNINESMKFITCFSW